MDRRVAIVGYSFRLPQTSTDTFWQDLVDEKDLITEVEHTRWAFDNHLHPNKDHPGSSYTFQAGSLGDISGFDADFFGISPREAAIMDPQQRHLLELTWEAIEHAGIKASELKKTNTGVFFGISSLDYSYRLCDDLSAINSSAATGNTSSIGSNRISYSFDLQGPSMSIDTACSSAMVAFHQACQSILSGETTTALTGGISLHLHPYGFIIFSKATMLSPDGRCKVFDKSANGYVRSEGGGVFLLKDYDQAIADGDTIHAIVAGSSVNTDGNKSGITIPSCHAQQQLMEHTYQKAGIQADEVDYIEAHGTGTPVGDPIETRAIGNALGRKRSSPLPIGSVKSNLGHLEPASAVAGLVKSILILKHRAVPATISMKEPNPDIRFDEWNIQVVDHLQPLKTDGPLTVGINSFGFGGANAHVILQSDEAETKTANISVTDKEQKLPLVISGHTEQALLANAARLKDYFLSHPDNSMYDIAWNYTLRKERHQEARLFYVKSKEDAYQQLQDCLSPDNDTKNNPHTFSGQGLTSSPGAIFVYSGNGCQWETMGKTLLEQSDVFSQAIEDVDQLFSQYADFSLLDEISGKNGNGRFEFTEIAQPSLFAIQVGITEYLKHQGVTPSAVIGHSVGEVAAAWACGALTLEDAVKVIFYRSQCQGETKGTGAMSAAAISQKEAEAFLQKPEFSGIHLAGVNSYKGVTLAGDPAQLSALESRLESKNIFNVRLPLDYAFHSPAMAPIEQQLLRTLTGLKPHTSRIPFVSTVTGYPIDGSALDAGYWWRNIRKPVLFEQAIDHCITLGYNCFIEVGAHPVLRSYQQDQARKHNITARLIPTFSRNHGTPAELNQCVASAILAGATDMSHWFTRPAPRLELPTYAWQHEPYWHPVTIESYELLARYSQHPLLGAPKPLQPLHWENKLDTGKHSWLADHKVGDSVVYPGAGFIELALTAASHFRDADYIEIEEFEILAPLILEDGHSKVIDTHVHPDSGDIEVASRTHTEAEQWTKNCKARAIHQTTGKALDILPPVIPNTPATFNAIAHQTLALKAGLQYGPAFSAVLQGWATENAITAELNLPQAITDQVDDYLLHPGILDSAIQLVIHFLTKELEKNSGTAFIPARAGRITVKRKVNQQPSLVQLTLKRKAPHSLLVRLEMFNIEGEAVAILEDLRFKAVRLYKSDKHQTAFLNYHLTPVSSSQSTDATLQASFNEATEQVCRQQTDRFSEEVAPLLESLMVHALAESLSEIKCKLGTLTDSDIEALNLQSPGQAVFRNQLIKTALEYGILEQTETGYLIADDFTHSEITSNLIWNTLVREYPDYFSAIHLSGRTSLALTSNFLSSQTELNDNQTKLTDNYQRFFKDLLTQTSYPIIASGLTATITGQLAKLNSGERLRILEVSSMQAHYGHSICAALNFNMADYTFASNHEEALNSITHLQERYPLANAIALDTADTEPYQLAILTIDNYQPAECLQQLQKMKALLATNAMVIITGLQPISWLNLAFGDNENWWLNGESVQTSAEQWLATLAQQNYSDLQLLSDSTADSGFFLIAGRYVGEKQPLKAPIETSGRSLIITKSNHKEQTLVNQITSELSETSTITVQTHKELKQYLLEVQSDTPFQQVILLANIGDNLDPLNSQTVRCAQLTGLQQTLEEIGSTARICILTEGVGAMFPADQPIQYSHTCTPADAALWGFGRTLMNEALNNPVRLIDLPSESGADAISTLVQELRSPGEEQEIIITPRGAKFAPRLRAQQAPASACAQYSKDVISLGFELPGQLRNLQWQAKAANSLAEDEVEIEVMATGLNFRDIMYALGLLSDEAIENGFAGATMGLEFSGKIIATGSGVENFNIGDPVVGFGASCFSNRMVATSYSISPIPANLSYEGAATIPTTFLTVYYALHHLARIQPGEKVLIHGAAGGVGIAAIQIAQWLGADIYATVGSTEKQEFLKLMGIPAERIYNSRQLTFAEEILRDTDDGKGVDVVLNSLAGEAIKQNFRVLKPFGRFLELGKRDFYENTHIGLRPFRNNISYFGIDADQLQQELPELTAKLFSEMMELFSDGTLFPLPYTKFNAHQVVDAFRYMQQAKQIGKIIVTYEEGLKADTVLAGNSEANKTLKLDPQASYLITGGLGGFGLKTAQWLITKGARNLILLSRRGATSEEANAFLTECANTGIDITPIACDVTDKQALEEVIALCGNELPTLKGVIHAATLINDSLIRNLDRDQIKSAMAAKMRGAQYLDELTRHLSLDLFVLYSSATTLLGNPGQAAYVAANHWLEALAATRQASGLAATCVRWGAINDVGFLARNEDIKDALQNRLGGNALDSDEGLKILEQMLLTNSEALGVMELDWHALSRFLPTAHQMKFREVALTAGEAEHSDEETLDLQTMMQEMNEEEFHSAILEIITHELSEILMIPVNKISPEKSIYDMGMDSLMGVELMSALESRMGIQVPVMALTETPKLTQLTEKIISLIHSADTVVTATDNTQAAVEQVFAQHGASDSNAKEKVIDSIAATDTQVNT